MEDIKIIQDSEEFYKLKEEWTALEKESDTTYYSSYEYNSIWWDSVKDLKKYELFVITIRENGALQGIAPLIIKKERYFPIKSLRFMAWGDTLNFIVKKGKNSKVTARVVEKIMKVIRENKECYDRVALTNIASDTCLAKVILKNPAYNSKFNMMMENPQLKFSKSLSYEDYRKNNEAKNMKQKKNALKRKFGYQIKFQNNKEANSYETIKKLHIDLQKNRREKLNMSEKNSPFTRQEYDCFLEKLFKKSENIYNYLITNEKEEVISYITGYLYKDTFHGWNCAYDFRYNDDGIGKITFSEAIDHNFNNLKFSTWDYGWGRYPWKFEFTEDYINLYEIRWWNNPRLDKLEKISKKIIEIIKVLKN